MQASKYDTRQFLIENLVLELLEDVASDLHPEQGGGKVTASAYDTAWVARIRHPDNRTKLAFPQSLGWLLEQQSNDGSWEGPPPYNLLPTMAALLALISVPEPSARTCQAANHAKSYLQKALVNWNVKDFESSGFEVLAPALLYELENRGITFNFPEKPYLINLHSQKLALTDPKLIYSGETSLSHSLEAFGAKLDFTRLKSQQAIGGSYGCSPAATAAVLIYGPTWDSAAAKWLSGLYEHSLVDGFPGAMPVAYPIDIFECSWVLYNLAWVGLLTKPVLASNSTQVLVNWIRGSLGADGVSMSRFKGFPPDADDTGMVIAALRKTGIKVAPQPLFNFERDSYFVCYNAEREASISANAHVLAALLSLSKPEIRLLKAKFKKIVDFLYSQRKEAGYWEDKWHTSPYYATACTVLALAGHSDLQATQKLLPTLNWVLENQNLKDGGWCSSRSICNESGSNMEETAYGLQILKALSGLVNDKNYNHYNQALLRGTQFMWRELESFNQGTANIPKMWRAKNLYTPLRVTNAIVLSALGI